MKMNRKTWLRHAAAVLALAATATTATTAAFAQSAELRDSGQLHQGELKIGAVGPFHVIEMVGWLTPSARAAALRLPWWATAMKAR